MIKLNAKQRLLATELLEAWRLDVRMAVKPGSFQDIREHQMPKHFVPETTPTYQVKEVFGKDVPYEDLSCMLNFSDGFKRKQQGEPFCVKTPEGLVFIDPQGGSSIRYAAMVM